MPTPLKQIRKECLFCSNNQSEEIRKCPSKLCFLYDLRFGKGKSGISALKQIKLKCADCSDGVRKIGKCDRTECELFIYKLGKNPKRKGIGNTKIKSILTQNTSNSRN